MEPFNSDTRNQLQITEVGLIRVSFELNLRTSYNECFEQGLEGNCRHRWLFPNHLFRNEKGEAIETFLAH